MFLLLFTVMLLKPHNIQNGKIWTAQKMNTENLKWVTSFACCTPSPYVTFRHFFRQPPSHLPKWHIFWMIPIIFHLTIHYVTTIGIITSHCMKSVQIRSYFWSVFSCIRTKYRKYGPEITPYLDIFHAVSLLGEIQIII